MQHVCYLLVLQLLLWVLPVSAQAPKQNFPVENLPPGQYVYYAPGSSKPLYWTVPPSPKVTAVPEGFAQTEPPAVKPEVHAKVAVKSELKKELTVAPSIVQASSIPLPSPAPPHQALPAAAQATQGGVPEQGQNSIPSSVQDKEPPIRSAADFNPPNPLLNVPQRPAPASATAPAKSSKLRNAWQGTQRCLNLGLQILGYTRWFW